MSKSVKGTVWSEDEITFLRSNYEKLSVSDIADTLGRAYSSVCMKAKKMGISKPRETTSKNWTFEEIQYLKDNYIVSTSSELGHYLGRSKASVDRKLCSLGFRKMDTVDYFKVRGEFEKIGWELLSESYVNSRTKLKYRCDKGHVYYITWNKFRERKRCPKCYYDRDDFFDSIVAKCKESGYIVLTENYIDSETPLHLRCNKNHVFSMTWNSINSGSKCPQCFCSGRISAAEKEIIKHVRMVLGSRKVYGNLKSIIYPYELDIYIPSKNLAIEYCGLYWHSEEQGKDKYYHKRKYDMCRDKGIRLITVFEDEYLRKRELVLDRINRELGVIHKVEIDNSPIFSFDLNCTLFLEENSFLLGQEERPKTLSILNGDKETLCVISYTKDNEKLDILSIDEKIGIGILSDNKVFDGAIKILINKHNPKVINYFNNMRWPSLYIEGLKKVGFSLNGFSGPCCNYIYKHDRLVKPNKLLDKKGMNRIWDCGYSKYCLILGGCDK